MLGLSDFLRKQRDCDLIACMGIDRLDLREEEERTLGDVRDKMWLEGTITVTTPSKSDTNSTNLGTIQNSLHLDCCTYNLSCHSMPWPLSYSESIFVDLFKLKE